MGIAASKNNPKQLSKQRISDCEEFVVQFTDKYDYGTELYP